MTHEDYQQQLILTSSKKTRESPRPEGRGFLVGFIH